MERKLFEHFPSVTTDEWEKIIAKDLKKEDISSLEKFCDSVHLKCFYTDKDTQNIEHQELFDKENNLSCSTTRMYQLIDSTSPKKANVYAHEYLNSGLNTVAFSFSKNENVDIDIATILKDISLEKIPCYYESDVNATLVFSCLLAEAKRQNISFTKIMGAIDNDPLLFLMSQGEIAKGKDFLGAKHILEMSDQMPNFTGMMIRGDHLHEKGASVVEELAFTMTAAIEYVDQFTEMGLSCEQFVRNIQFSFGVSTNFFLEIAKLRAAKLVWANIVSQFSLPDQYPISIHSYTSKWNKTHHGEHTNIIRTTIEAMASILGGSSSLSIASFDNSCDNKMGMRIAKNIGLLLQEEAFLKQNKNPVSGSFYLENITHEIASKSWQLIQETEKQGGMVKALKTGYIQDKIAATHKQKLHNLESQKIF